ncbi:hypothetical protein SAMN04489860_2566 [Paraoerskovia marina]|uniref:DUF6318 domain-containing protein n=1 Tax=Paraoerskovia marina TaxID=545619 RepID=A0A1H1VP39_9CELL|nr:DUF6318 family protein [Paraoerskovia marina]SDS86552.1 hypothetical protein SAMN04489860_2566 [Paraoerskovia marina]
MRVRRRTLALVLPVALALSLGGCSSDDEPEPGSGVTTSAASTASASETPEPAESPEPEPAETAPTPPPRPTAMDDTGKKGAQAAAEYFIALLNFGLASGNSQPLAAIRLPDMCVTCGNFIDRIDSYDDSNYSVEGGVGSLSDLDVSERDTLTGGYAVFAKFATETMTVTDPGGDVVESVGGDDGNLQIDVMHDGTDWKVMSMVTDQGRAE